MALHRLQPALPAAGMQTYAALLPLATHWRPATCGEVDCQTQAGGWVTRVDEATDLGQRQAHYIRAESGRAFTEEREGGLTVFTFPAGQECFATHQMPLERPPLLLVRGGDWRGNPRGTPARVHQRPEDWIDDMQTSLDATRRRVEG
jgi:hypothetical protein